MLFILIFSLTSFYVEVFPGIINFFPINREVTNFSGINFYWVKY